LFQDPRQLAHDAVQLPGGEGGRSHPQLFHPNDFKNLKLLFSMSTLVNQDEKEKEDRFKRLLDVVCHTSSSLNLTFNVQCYYFYFLLVLKCFSVCVFLQSILTICSLGQQILSSMKSRF